jgi:glycolate oxidase FAD binding subunit
VKNVTGYDLMRLWCGSLGTLGIITQVALRVYPAAETVDLKTGVASVEEGVALAERLYRADIRPEIADVICDASGQRLVIRVMEAAVRAARSVLGSLAQEVEAGPGYVTSRDLGYGSDDALLLSVSVTPSLLGEAFEAVSMLSPTAAVARPVVPVIRAAWRSTGLPSREAFAAQLAGLRSLLADGRGSATVERMPADWHKSVDPWGIPRTGLDIMRKLKAAYDPHGRFNRGRFAGGI